MSPSPSEFSEPLPPGGGGIPRVDARAVRRKFVAAGPSGAAAGGGDHVAVDDVSLTVRAGEFFSLLGPSGCGKTTLLRLIAGFEQPDAGRIYIDGVDVTPQPPAARPTNLVFQHYALFPHLSVWKNVAFGLRYQKVPRSEAQRRVAEALDRVRLTGFDRRAPHELSGGQRQRVALARALVLKPKVLLLDEPLGALDQKLRREMQVELKQIQRSLGMTFVFVTHDQEEALVMSDRVGVMNGGRLEQVGSSEQVFERPATAFVARFMGADNFFTRDGRTFVVRPENLRLRRTEGGSVGAATAVTVIERIYQGVGTTYKVQDEHGTAYTVYAQKAGNGVDRIDAGDRATLNWDTVSEVALEGAS